MANSRLGRGFAALISDMREIDSPEIASYDEKGKLNQGVNEIAIDLIKANPNQPRKTFNEDSLNELAESIKTHGILQPLVVTKIGEYYRIVAGERRFRAAKRAELAAVPVIIRELSEKEVREIALVENLQREDLNPMEESEALYNLLTENNLTQEALAQAIGKSRPAVANSLRLLTLPVQVQALVRDLSLSTGHAKVLVAVKPAEMQIALAKEVVEKKMSVRDLEERIAELQKEKKAPAERVRTLSPEFKALLADMQRVFGTKVKATGNDKKGKIVIDYYSADDLQRIYDLIERLKEE
ncbi:MAG TPA: chromosome partitioning protein ParB [Clostridiales bacterium]|nr:chromosome partitioning protein ParB [Clostridiales bacterium]